jgi:hypothetical protein
MTKQLVKMAMTKGVLEDDEEYVDEDDNAEKAMVSHWALKTL